MVALQQKSVRQEKAWEENRGIKILKSCGKIENKWNPRNGPKIQGIVMTTVIPMGSGFKPYGGIYTIIIMNQNQGFGCRVRRSSLGTPQDFLKWVESKNLKFEVVLLSVLNLMILFILYVS